MGVYVKPIAFDSLGVRSMCIEVETDDLRMVIDPSVALGPRRYGLRPHRVERERLKELALKVEEAARDADLLIVTHYHYDHHDTGKKISVEIYDGKILIIKDPENNINPSQRFVRAPRFLKTVRERVRELHIGDGNEFKFRGTLIKFSKPVFHGINDKLGYVIEVLVSHGGETFIYSSDVEGPPHKDQLEFMLVEEPDLVVVDGPLTYMLGRRFPEEMLESSLANLMKLVREARPRKLVLDHHLLRDLNYREHLAPVYEIAGDYGVKVLTAAELLGVEPLLLEARRKELYERERAEEAEGEAEEEEEEE